MSKTGEVVVEGHAIGRLDGFVFVPDASSGGSEAKALANAAQKALAGEIANARFASCRSAGRAIRARRRRHGALDRRRRRQAHRRRGGVAAARARHRRRASVRRAARGRRSAARPLDQIPHRKTAWPAVRAVGCRRHQRHCPRRRVPIGRSARRARSGARRRRSQRPGAAGTRELAQIRRALRRLSHLPAAPAQAGAAGACRAIVGAGA